MRDFDFSPLFRSAIGFDRLPSLLDTAMRSAGSADSYPPYNIAKTGDDAYRISIAVAGFGRDDLGVEVRDGVLVVKGKTAADANGVEYLHRGIAGRAFERRFQLAEHVRADAADLVNGMLVRAGTRFPDRMRARSHRSGLRHGAPSLPSPIARHGQSALDASCHSSDLCSRISPRTVAPPWRHTTSMTSPGITSSS